MNIKDKYKMRENFIILVLIFLLVGCSPFNERQDATKDFIKKALKISKTENLSYEPKIRSIKPYSSYSYKGDLDDPFRFKNFSFEEEDKLSKSDFVKEVEVVTVTECLPPECVPPEIHDKNLLENYSLTSLLFVGVMSNKKQSALIQTPDNGVVEVKVGDYMGKNNGKVIQIKKSSITLQEKILNGRIWKNKKTVVVINR